VDDSHSRHMRIRAAQPTDRDALLDIWLRSVRATHTFLTEEDIQFYLPFVRAALESSELEVWVLRGSHVHDRPRARREFLRPAGVRMLGALE
jgi:hypothetical protein